MPSEPLKIELIDHVGSDGTKFPNFLVMANGRQVGIIGKYKGCHLNLLGGQKLTPAQKEEIRVGTEKWLKIAHEDPYYELPSVRTPPELPSADEIRKAIEANE